MQEPHKVITLEAVRLMIERMNRGSVSYSDVIKAIQESAVWIELSAYGDPATFCDGANGVPLKSLLVEISPTISGQTSATIIHTRNKTEADQYISSWESDVGIVYGGVLDLTNGTLTVTHGKIEKYNGEPIAGEWISDRDEYSAEILPSIGAQVVYRLESPTIYQIDPLEIKTCLGDNEIKASCGPVDVKYCADATLVYIDLLEKIRSSKPCPTGGEAGQVLMKNSNQDGDASWQNLPAFDGVYTITPKIGAETTMQTSRKYLDRNIEVKEIPVYITGNDSGGNTVIIGG